MTQQDRDRLVALKKAKKGLITQRQAAEEIGQSERHVRRLLKRLKGKGGRGAPAWVARPAIQPQAGREDQAGGTGDPEPQDLFWLRPDAGDGILGGPARDSGGA